MQPKRSSVTLSTGVVDTVGQRIRELREARGLSGNALAKLAGISQGHLRDIEIGRHKSPTLETARAIARALGVTLDNLIREPAESQG